jgi:hypothetical protein
MEGFSQDKKPLFQFKPLDNDLKKTFIDKYLKNKSNDFFAVNEVSVVPKGLQIIVLPLDNMPCLVPDMRDFNMPVLKLKAAGHIPAAR